jgi:small conductance mechanosensitive channel
MVALPSVSTTPTTPEALLPDALPDGLGWGDWMQAGIIIVVAVVLAVLLRRVVDHLAARLLGSPMVARLLGRLAASLIVVFGAVYGLNAIGVRIGPILGALGIGGIALAFALQNSLENLVAGGLLQVHRAVRVGDEVETNDHEGVVEDVRFHSVVIRTFDGERVLLPSSLVLSQPIRIRTAFASRRTALEVGVAYGTDLPRAAQVIAAAVADVDGVAAQPAPRAWVHQFGESSIDLTVHLWHRADQPTTWRTRHEACVAIDEAFKAAGIEIPFPQRTLWLGEDARVAVSTATQED